MQGFLLVVKPAHMTSHDVVQWVRRWSGQRRVGHTGTLDPMAEGLLPLLLGRATRLSGYLQELSKWYRAEVTFGAETDTHDAWGEVMNRYPVDQVNTAQLRKALEKLTGPQLQVPPMTSARRYQGRRLYELAREGKEVARPPRKIVIHRLELLTFSPPEGGRPPRALIDCVCSSGTYVRTLCAQIGRLVGSGAYMSYLLRCGVGPFTVAAAYTLEELAGLSPADRSRILLEPGQALSWLPALRLDPANARGVRHGQPPCVAAADLARAAAAPGGRARLYDPEGRFLAVARVDRDSTGDSTLRLEKVLA